MRINLKNLSILQQTYLLFGGFLILATVNYFVISHYKDKLSSFSPQLMELEYLEGQIASIQENIDMANNDNAVAKDNLSSQLVFFENELDKFKNGGVLTTSKVEIGEGSDRLNRLINNAHPAWQQLKDNIAIIINEEHQKDTTIQQAVMVAINDSTTTTEIQDKQITVDNHVVRKAANAIRMDQKKLPALITEMENIVRLDQQEADDTLSIILMSFLLFNAIAIVLVLLAIRNYVFVPLQNLGVLFSANDFSKKADYERTNEIGTIAKGFNNIATAFQRSTSFVAKIGEGKLDEKLEGIDESKVSEKSLEWALLNMRDQMKRMELEEAERKWSTGGLAKFVDILRANDNVQELSDAIISNLVDYTKSNQGGIYIINEEDPQSKYLELISLYAFNDKKYNQKSYRLGEGLVGQTYLERKTIYLFEIPEDYIEITSGLGDANPTTILLVPLKIENDIYGVIELASFHEFEEYQIQFVEKLGESIASTIAGVKANEKTKHLLEESQQLTEQMQAQEEEMRQNMEELSATQEEMARKEQAVMAQLDAINNSLGTAEFSVDGDIITTNEKYYQSLGYDHSSIVSANFFLLHTDADIFYNVRNGNSYSGWVSKNHRTAGEVIYKSSFNPIMDEEGEVVKIVELIVQFEKESETGAVDEWKELKDVEEELRQNMEALEITQTQLDNKLKISEEILSAFKSIGNYLIVDSEGNIFEVNNNAQKQIGGDHQNISTIFETPANIALTVGDQKELKILNAGTITVSVRDISADDASKKLLIIWT
ncbi:GAF domain-containing protein [Fulvivirga sp.]|uniref:GAF domain-containing protein n=1 Tax=Fulvivirga sp. TaxID=1931237 RepID=UPI0032ECB54E